MPSLRRSIVVPVSSRVAIACCSRKLPHAEHMRNDVQGHANSNRVGMSCSHQPPRNLYRQLWLHTRVCNELRGFRNRAAHVATSLEAVQISRTSAFWALFGVYIASVIIQGSELSLGTLLSARPIHTSVLAYVDQIDGIVEEKPRSDEAGKVVSASSSFLWNLRLCCRSSYDSRPSRSASQSSSSSTLLLGCLYST